MVREFTDQPVETELVAALLELARRAPSAGNTQGSEFLVLEGASTGGFWDCTLPDAERATFVWPGLLRAPVLVIPLASQQAYLNRYGEPDKAHSKMGADAESWPVPFWDTDCAFATMNLLLAANSRGLGALFFAIVRGREELKANFDVPVHMSPLGAVAIGWPAPDRPGASSSRSRRGAEEVVHWGRYGAAAKVDRGPAPPWPSPDA